MRESLAFLVCKQRAVIEDDELFSLDGGLEDGLGVLLALGVDGQSLAMPTSQNAGI